MHGKIARYLASDIRADLDRKMVFMAGPRQAGKTTLAKSVQAQAGFSADKWYMNWDAAEDRENILESRFPGGEGILVLDEIHKYTRWRQTVKGLYDKRGDDLKILVTGSAKLDYYRYGGDSLQGRYHFYRLHPLSIAELNSQTPSDLSDLMAYGGFPEPFLSGSEKEAKRWRREYRTRLVREDLQDLERVKDVSLIERLALRLPDLVGSPLSINGLREDLQVSHQTVSRWVQILENLYMIFRIYPFGAPAIRAVKKEAKHYHMDWALVKDPGARFENLVACHLLKWCHYQSDTEGREMSLRYFRDIERREVDFVIMEEEKPIQFIECKSGNRSTSRSLRYLKQRFPDVEAIQVARSEGMDHINKDNIHLLSATTFLSSLV